MSTIVTFPLQDSSSTLHNIRRFSVDEYHDMIRSGILTEDEPVELLDGLIVKKMPRNPIHDLALEKADSVLRRFIGTSWRMRIQSAITTNDSEPEPNIALIRGAIPAQVQSHPSPDQVAMVVEIANSSLDYDRATKGPIYARANIPVYWIVNLVERRLEVYTNPSPAGTAPGYDSCHVFSENDSVELILDSQSLGHFSVSDMLA